jgi:hypothetical protein
MNAAMAASTALPPRRKTSDPAVVASGVEVAIAPPFCEWAVAADEVCACASGEVRRDADGAAARMLALLTKKSRRELIEPMKRLSVDLDWMCWKTRIKSIKQ